MLTTPKTQCGRDNNVAFWTRRDTVPTNTVGTGCNTNGTDWDHRGAAHRFLIEMDRMLSATKYCRIVNELIKGGQKRKRLQRQKTIVLSALDSGSEVLFAQPSRQDGRLRP